MKLENHNYLVKRHKRHMSNPYNFEQFIIGYPVYENDNLVGWLDQQNIRRIHYEDDDIIGSIERIEERKWIRSQIEKKFKKEHPEIKL